MLSTTYKKAAEVAKKSSKAALSLILVFFAFLGFNSMPTNNDVPTVVTGGSVSSTETAGSTEVSEAKPSASASASTSPSAAAKAKAAAINAKATYINFAGLDKSGVPTGFTVADSSGALGSLYITNREPVLSETELTLSQVAKTDEGAANIFLSQQFVSDFNSFNYLPSLSYGKVGSWAPLVTSVTYLDSEVETPVVIPATASGRDLLQAPRQVITRLVLNSGKTQILAQAIYVVEKGAK
jgi:hypothetical protein